MTLMPPRDFPALIRDVPDFPKPGIQFKDITPLLADPAGFAWVIETLAAPWRGAGVDCVAGIEARGFILGAALARSLDAGFVPVRKPGKLPARVITQDYALEYGSDRLEIHEDAVRPGTRVLLVDDVLATGGTLLAARALLERTGATLVGAAVLVELVGLAGRARWNGANPLEASLRY
ncbi:adenine phosphoribosyltransferase [Aerolutibacter ruishenii]|uniref:Adenine phosphoribosyltransferase n=1 Tax=Aerolutibacter ruishenii TaxID=686800 RepID=A0A562M377_9GAMM|nr:adenine phosphoribosyltransferase [Lysobacter ruishenii]TWI14051.1 adenine phosphoribosyltransferase [Lysobacter ruishenii]